MMLGSCFLKLKVGNTHVHIAITCSNIAVLILFSTKHSESEKYLSLYPFYYEKWFARNNHMKCKPNALSSGVMILRVSSFRAHPSQTLAALAYGQLLIFHLLVMMQLHL